ncbi:hypothetical protein [Paludisphaera borealis]|uniref:Uncharacterized protein n=1 Tax=Paludisphaera borealis TaxID=1387353 RepID=A0A1U7CR96_9BACT|nr:hypothetical protein [Paludisphaera borealis]APW61465.1 hypothetical protein BSF38_02979 [Paludisphaera borealis]
MRRYRFLLVGLAISCFGGGCGEDQPNTSAAPEEVNADFAKKSADMMKAANTGMDKKNLRPGGQAAPKPAN